MSRFSGLVELCGQLVNLPIATRAFQESATAETLHRLHCTFQEQVVRIREQGVENHPLRVTQLYGVFQEMCSLVFQYSEDDHMQSLLEMYLEVYPDSAEHILRFWDRYQFNPSEEGKSVLVQGDVQSGKTAMMILTAFLYLVRNRDVVFLFRNRNADKIQFKTRFQQFVERLREWGYTNRNFYLVDRKDREPSHPCVFLDIYNKKNVKRMTRKLQRRHPATAVLYMDEADIRDDTADIEFKELVDLVGTKLFVSATVQDLLVSDWKITGASIVPLFRSEQYRGMEHTTFIEMVETESGDLDVHDAMNRVIADEWTHPYHPKIVLLSCDRRLNEMNAMMMELRRHRLRQRPLNGSIDQTTWMTYTFEGIRLFHPHIIESELKEYFPRLRREQDDIYLLKTELKNVLRWMAENGGQTVYPMIVIIAGDMASRGINFAYHHPTRQDCNWHLTHQIGLKSKNASCATLNQFMRIFGNHGDDVPLKFYSSKEMMERIRESYRLSKKITHTLHDANEDFHRPEFSRMYTSESCKQIPLVEEVVPRKFLAKKSIRDTFKMVRIEEPALNQDEVPSFHAQTLTAEEIRWMEGKFHEWRGRRDLFISKLMFRIDPIRTYSRVELIRVMEQCGFTHPNPQLLTYFDVNQQTNGYGKIMTCQANHYKMYSELVELHRDIFH